jgi:hypothetical protein
MASVEFTIELEPIVYDVTLSRVGPQGPRGEKGDNGHEYSLYTSSEALSAGDYVNIWLDGATYKIRKATATDIEKEAHGFILLAYASGATCATYFSGNNTEVTSQTEGPVFLSLVSGLGTATPPTGVGNVVQRIGIAASSTQVSFNPQQPIRLAQ